MISIMGPARDSFITGLSIYDSLVGHTHETDNIVRLFEQNRMNWIPHVLIKKEVLSCFAPVPGRICVATALSFSKRNYFTFTII